MPITAEPPPPSSTPDASSPVGATAECPETSSLLIEGTPDEQRRLREMVEEIRNSGPEGAALIAALENSPTPVRLRIAASATVVMEDETIDVPLFSGGVTLPPGMSLSGDIEVHVDPANLINVRAEDGSLVRMTPEGVLAHELTHARLMSAGDPSQVVPGEAAEIPVNRLTNDIRVEMGLDPLPLTD